MFCVGEILNYKKLVSLSVEEKQRTDLYVGEVRVVTLTHFPGGFLSKTFLKAFEHQTVLCAFEKSLV